ncbi:Clp protease N-terminal domain-containing protein [Streptomyces sp. NPDC051567]|uniref:Clp protease N-terminal domain-containing protein n=1 Tax=Streptomyces sp. NPDC051567 TaxID=3365660 RepID=UPI00378D731F
MSSDNGDSAKNAGGGAGTVFVEPDWTTVGILGSARGAREEPGDPIGTEHLLGGITHSKGDAAQALALAGVTKAALLAVLRDRQRPGGAWHTAEAAGAAGAEPTECAEYVGSKAVLGEHGDSGVRFTGAAARALTAAAGLVRAGGKPAAKQRITAEHLLRALLAEENRAGEAVRICGTAPAAVLALLDGGEPVMDDGLDPCLHPTRDALLGLRSYRSLGFLRRWIIAASGVNWAADPLAWIRMELQEQLMRLGDREAGTEHILLAVLATHEVAARYPHMADEETPRPSYRYAGGERLQELGIGYAAARNALAGNPDLGSDPRPAGKYLQDVLTGSGTGPLVESLLVGETRAQRLVEALVASTGSRPPSGPAPRPELRPERRPTD